MRKLMIPLALTLVAASPAASKRDPVPEAVPDGKPVECLQLTQIRDQQVRSDSVIDFVTNGGKVYRNTLPQPCPELGFEQRFVHKTTLNQICAIDTITVLHDPPSIQGATCGLGQFQPVKLVKH